MNKGPQITTDNLSVSFGSNNVLDKIDFRADPGQVHAIIGPNGSGKTTFIKSILGQINHSGTIRIHWPKEPGTVGYMPQTIAIDNTVPLTVLDYIAICIQKKPAIFGLSKEHRREVDRILELLHLSDKKKYMFSELSGGERQRVLFSQALIPDPDLLILDEPMNNVDRAGAGVFSETIYAMRDRGCTIIWIHHDLEEVREKADQVSCFNRNLLFTGPPSEVMDDSHILRIFSAR
ncbi:MAG: metal ABC transporter ATP-binding protein [Fibrobacterota bacterium]